MKYDIITIGSAVRDVFLVSKEIKILGGNECVTLGAKIDLDKLIMATGGGATNAAVTFGHLGFATAAIARVGQDSSGAEIIGELKNHHVDTSLMRVVTSDATAYSTLLTEPYGGERTALVYRGASAEFTEKDIPWSKMNSKWLYMTSLAGNLDLAKKLITRLGSKTKICWNPGGGELKKGLKAFAPLFDRLFLLNMNKEEADQLFGGKDPAKLIPHTLCLVITDGPRGATAHLDGMRWHIDGSKVKVVSRTGAGDAFGSGLVAALMQNWGIEDALRLGLMNSESVIQHYGAKMGIIKAWPKPLELKRIAVKIV